MPDFINATAPANGPKDFLGIPDNQSFTVEQKSTWRVLGQNRDQPITIRDTSTNPPKEFTGYVTKNDLAKMKELAAQGYDVYVNPGMSKEFKGQVILK